MRNAVEFGNVKNKIMENQKMLKKYEILKKVEQEKIVAIVRVDDAEKAERCFDALRKGGIKVIEMTFTIPYAHTMLEKLSKKYKDDITIGAGTVLDSETARLAIMSGAEFVVSPSFNADVAKLCNRYSIPYFCGVNTPTEAISAMEAGVEVVKLFPANNFKPSVIKDFRGPFPNIAVMPTGGVNLATIKEWIKAGAFACGVGGELVNGYKTGDYDGITEAAKNFIREIQE